jgi:hypothetical protein
VSGRKTDPVGDSKDQAEEAKNEVGEPKKDNKPSESKGNLAAWLTFAGVVATVMGSIVVALVHTGCRDGAEIQSPASAAPSPSITSAPELATGGRAYGGDPLGKHETPTPTPTRTQPPTPLNREEERTRWYLVIANAENSPLAKSFVPDRRRVFQLIRALDVTELLLKLIQEFEQEANDTSLGRWLTPIKNNLHKIDDHLLKLNRRVLRFREMILLGNNEKTDLQIAEYARVELLGDLIEMTKAFGVTDPNFTTSLTVGKVPGIQTQ